MSERITSKNLSYSSSLPPFLARLHAEVGGAKGPDPLLAAHKRSSKKRSSSEEAEDAPLIVDEHGNSLDVQVDKDGAVRESEHRIEEAHAEFQPDVAIGKLEQEGKSSIGARKRKAGKVIGETAVTGRDGEPKAQKTSDESRGAVQKVKKKTKKIKLSFDDPDEG